MKKLKFTIQLMNQVNEVTHVFEDIRLNEEEERVEFNINTPSLYYATDIARLLNIHLTEDIRDFKIIHAFLP